MFGLWGESSAAPRHGRAVAIAFAREGTDVLISYLDEHHDAEETARWVEQAGREACSCPATWPTRITAAPSSTPPSRSSGGLTSW